ncbi:hypothetical protein Scep_014359 [Stephania cephalantha]|uniref:Uncharacterized protein n=1 Tax=Stephania cephalantha TaxID=152367 RepID=A0AAP0P0A6_9MAGN
MSVATSIQTYFSFSFLFFMSIQTYLILAIVRWHLSLEQVGNTAINCNIEDLKTTWNEARGICSKYVKAGKMLCKALQPTLSLFGVLLEDKEEQIRLEDLW